jgi:hypothetical protein
MRFEPFSKLRPRSVYDVMAAIACFGVLAGGTAYAANEWTGANIVDGSLTGQDVFDNTIGASDITNNSLTNADIQDFSLGNGDFLTGSVDSRVVTNNSLTGTDVADNSLTGTDINESTLNLPQTPTTATFAGNAAPVDLSASFTTIAAKSLPAGSWGIVATANTTASGPDNGDVYGDVVCELRNGNSFIGGATDVREKREPDKPLKRSLSMNGGAQVPAGGGQVSLKCKSDNQYSERVTYAQMMIIRLDGFF